MPSYYIDDNKTFEPSTTFIPFTHITDTYEKLASIIEEGFKISYCVETISNNDRNIRAAFPMISLSNLTLESSKYALGSYGTYGIALNKKFVEKYKFNPVLYLERHSDITSQIVNSFDTIRDKYWEDLLESHLFNDESKHETVLFSKNLLTQFAYSKNYDAQLIRKEILVNPNYRFGLEREWRIVHKQKDKKYFLVNDDVDKRFTYNKDFEIIRYTIELDDIFEIMVETDYQINAIKELLQNKYGNSDIKIIINSRRHIDDEG